MTEFAGDFEMHITVRAAEPATVEALRVWAERRQIAFHHIVLDRGETPSQPMIGRRGRGTLSEQLAAADELSQLLLAAGFCVSRVKIEAAPWNRDVPNTDTEGAARPGRYFEHHVKLALEPATDIAALAALAVKHAAHLSRNARRVRDEGRQERFVTQRCYAVGRTTARERLAALLTALSTDLYTLVSVEEEYVVYDSAPGVDAGWLDEGGTA